MATLLNTPSGVHATGLPDAIGNRGLLRRGTSAPVACPTLAELIAREKIRARIEAAIARLINALDAFDGDPDIEPSIGSSALHGQWAVGSRDDCEDVDEDGGDINDELHDGHDIGDHDLSDKEPSLGWPEHFSQAQAGRCDASGGTDLEDVNGVDRLTWEGAHA